MWYLSGSTLFQANKSNSSHFFHRMKLHLYTFPSKLRLEIYTFPWNQHLYFIPVLIYTVFPVGSDSSERCSKTDGFGPEKQARKGFSTVQNATLSHSGCSVCCIVSITHDLNLIYLFKILYFKKTTSLNPSKENPPHWFRRLPR